MAWRKQLRKASFKGVSFFVQSAEGSFGRRVVVHEFPRKDFPFAEDIGKKSREFSFDAYVLGEDYFKARNNLLRVCQEAGGGDLVHPYLGKIFAICTGIKLKESAASGGIAEMTLTFVETAAASPEPKTKLDGLAALLAAAEELRDVATAKIDSAFSVIGQANAVVETGVSAVESVTNSLTAVEKSIRGNILKVSEFAYKVRRFKAAVNTILGIPGRLSATFKDCMKTLRDAFGGNETAVKIFAKLVLPNPVIEFQKLTPGETANVKKIVGNAESLDQYVKQVTASYHAEILTETTFASLDDAVAARDALIATLEEQKEVADDDSFQAIEKLRVALLAAVPDPNQNLSKLVSVSVEDTTPSLVLSYEIYEDLENESDLVLRNSLEKPGFIGAGLTLKVLSDA